MDEPKILKKIANDKEMMNLKAKLESVSDSYYDFVIGLLITCSRDEDTKKRVIKYLDEHPRAETSDILLETTGL